MDLRLSTIPIPAFSGGKISLLQLQERTFPLSSAAILSFSHLAFIAGAARGCSLHLAVLQRIVGNVRNKLLRGQRDQTNATQQGKRRG